MGKPGILWHGFPTRKMTVQELNFTMTQDQRTFTPAEDVIEPFSDGSGSKVVAKAGKPIRWDAAIQLGLIGENDKPTVKGAVNQPGDSAAKAVEEAKRG